LKTRVGEEGMSAHCRMMRSPRSRKWRDKAH
jgi:hypothetical protein